MFECITRAWLCSQLLTIPQVVMNPATAEAAICANLGQPLTTKEWSAYVPDVPYHAPCS